MKKVAFILCAMALALVFSVPEARAQGAAKSGPDASAVRDPEMEKDSLHNLEVARLYFKLRKAYRAALGRCEEIIAGHPTFSKIDEVLYIAAMSSLRLSENKGKQAATTPADKLREDAREYFSMIVNEFPDSTFRSEAEKELKGLGGAKPKESKPNDK